MVDDPDEQVKILHEMYAEPKLPPRPWTEMLAVITLCTGGRYITRVPDPLKLEELETPPPPINPEDLPESMPEVIRQAILHHDAERRASFLGQVDMTALERVVSLATDDDGGFFKALDSDGRVVAISGNHVATVRLVDTEEEFRDCIPLFLGEDFR
jgi:hypothetical protein